MGTVVGDDGKEHASEECMIACEEARNKKAMGDSGLKYFKVAIDALFKNWTALQMLARDGAGGPQSRDKAEWMTGATENWFYENKDLDVYERDSLKSVISIRPVRFFLITSLSSFS